MDGDCGAPAENRTPDTLIKSFPGVELLEIPELLFLG